jgi:hypothetical protein
MLLIIFILIGYLLSKFTAVPKHETYSEIESKIKNK